MVKSQSRNQLILEQKNNIKYIKVAKCCNLYLATFQLVGYIGLKVINSKIKTFSVEKVIKIANYIT